MDLLAIDSPFRLNDIYYIRKQIIPALQRVFGLVGADLNQWFSEMPRPAREAVGKRHSRDPANSHRKRIDYYYLSKHCIICGDLVQTSKHFCLSCSKNEATVAIALAGRASKLEKDIQHLAAVSINYMNQYFISNCMFSLVIYSLSVHVSSLILWLVITCLFEFWGSVLWFYSKLCFAKCTIFLAESLDLSSHKKEW